MTIFVVRSLWQQPYLKRGCDYENFPGRRWRRRRPPSGGSTPYRCRS
ncbi:MAG: hypothetical protein V8T86_07225 [Victivallis sp.]